MNINVLNFHANTRINISLTITFVHTNKNIYTFVHTNFVITIMTLEEALKSKLQYPIERRTVLNIAYTQNVLAEAFNELIKQHDISPEQFNVLRILRGQKGNPINMSDIGERMIARTSNTTRLVDKLLLKELVTRDICPGNRRKMEIRITDKGLDLLKTLDPIVDGHEQKFAANLSMEELVLLNELLEKFRSI